MSDNRTPADGMSSNRKGKQPRDNSPRGPPATPSRRDQGVSQQVPRQPVFAPSSGFDANGQNAAQRAQWAAAVGMDLSTPRGGGYASNHPLAPPGAHQLSAPRNDQFSRQMGPSTERQPPTRGPPASDPSLLRGPSGLTQAQMDSMLAQPRASFYGQPYQPPVGRPRGQHTDNWMGSPGDHQSRRFMNTPPHPAGVPFGSFNTARPSSRPAPETHRGLGSMLAGSGSQALPPAPSYGQIMLQREEDRLRVRAPQREKLRRETLGQAPRHQLAESRQGNPMSALGPDFAPSLSMMDWPSPLPLQHGTQGLAQGDAQLTPMDLSRPMFRTLAAAQSTMDHIHWKTIPRAHGVSQTPQKRLPYVKKIYDAIVSLDKIKDAEVFPRDVDKFRPITGTWGSRPYLIEATAHKVVDLCVDLHEKGATGPVLGAQLHELIVPDRMLTFAQRIYFMVSLLRGYKSKADMVMLGTFMEQYVARIWSTLREQHEFVDEWDALSPELKLHNINVAPFFYVPASLPTAQEYQQMCAVVNQEIQWKQQQAALRNQQLADQQPDQDQSAMKRPVHAVENAEAGPSTKRRDVGGSTALFASPEQIPHVSTGRGPGGFLDAATYSDQFAQTVADATPAGEHQVDLDDLFIEGAGEFRDDEFIQYSEDGEQDAEGEEDEGEQDAEGEEEDGEQDAEGESEDE